MALIELYVRLPFYVLEQAEKGLTQIRDEFARLTIQQIRVAS